ncbi:TolC family outer membrane protein [Betaproteobacteria bacterium SCN2]|jgi:adhesin transport system outer membrane protein|nr:TolC family outer membrane protein [Betaproteobacteria bacterium SCN2]
MISKWFKVSVLAAMVSTAYAQPISIKDAAQEAVLRNPEVQAKWHAYKEATENVGIAKGRYYPSLDLNAGIFREWMDEPAAAGGDRDFTSRGVELRLNQILFDGFATRSDVKRLNYAQRVRYYELLDASETAALEAMRAYNDVLRYRALHKLAEQNYVQHRAVYEQIQRKVKLGVGRGVDLEQASGRLALAESNLLTEASNLHDVSARYQRIVGSLPAEEMAALPKLTQDVPPKTADALRKAYELNPQLAAANENIVSSMADVDVKRAPYYPRLDLQAAQSWGWDTDGIDGTYDNRKIGLALNYNLFRGGSDAAGERAAVERVSIAKDLRDKVCRDVRQTLTIAHNDIGRLGEQLQYLEQHLTATEKARDAYRKQFDIGQRTLLDLLDTENELFEARRAYLNASHDYVQAYGRTHGATGTLLASIGLQRLDTPNLFDGKEKAEFDPDTICPPSGVGQLSVDKDKVFADAMAANPGLLPPETAPVGDADGDGVTDDKDKCPDTPKGTRVDHTGCPLQDVTILKGVNFDFDKDTLRPDAKPILDEAAAVMQRYPEIKVEIGGHTDSVGSDEYNRDLSDRRARTVMDYFISKGVDAGRLSSKGYGEAAPVTGNESASGRAQNRRVEMRVIK